MTLDRPFFIPHPLYLFVDKVCVQRGQEMVVGWSGVGEVGLVVLLLLIFPGSRSSPTFFTPTATTLLLLLLLLPLLLLLLFSATWALVPQYTHRHAVGATSKMHLPQKVEEIL